MLPNLNPGPIDVFGLKLHAFGFLVGCAIIVGTIIAGRRAKKLGLSERVVADVAIWAVVGGFVGAHLYSAIFYFPEKIVEDPFYLLYLWDGISSFGGFIGATLAVVFYFRRQKELPFLPYADAIIYGFAFAWIFGRLGCTVAFDHPGLETDFALGMEYTGSGKVGTDSYISAAVRHNLGMYEAMWAMFMAAFFFLNRNKVHFKGWYLSVFVIAYMPLRFLGDNLRVADATHGGLTAGQWASFALLGLGVFLFVKAREKGELLPPDGKIKYWPKADLAAHEARLAKGSARK